MNKMQKDNVALAKIILERIIENSSELEVIINNSNDIQNSRMRNQIEEVIECKLSFDFLYYSNPSSINNESVLDDQALTNTQCLIDIGIFLLTSKKIKREMGFAIINITNIIGYLFDRHSYSYYVNQDKLKSLVDLLFELSQDQNSFERTLRNPLYLYKILYERNLEVERILEENNIDDPIALRLPQIRQKVRENYSQNQFGELDAYENSNKDIYSTIDDYEFEAQRFYSIPDYSKKNIGGYIALFETNLEFGKLETYDSKIKLRQIKDLKFTEIKENDSLINVALTDDISILSIKIMD
ncbi:MAG: hypothetical protein JWN78_774 [Bacteroidota bacterium]|nr:hypothetical protein [Bacteroidota bacterium]